MIFGRQKARKLRPAPGGNDQCSTEILGVHQEGGYKGAEISEENNLNAGPRRVGGGEFGARASTGAAAMALWRALRIYFPPPSTAREPA